MEKFSLSTKCFPVLKVGMYWGPLNFFDDCEIVDEKGLNDFMLATANRCCFEHLKEDLAPYVTDIKAVSVGDVIDHNYGGDTWLDIEAIVDTDGLVSYYMKHKNEIWSIPEFCEFALEKYRGDQYSAYSAIEEKKSSWREWIWQSCLLVALLLHRGKAIDAYQEDFFVNFVEGYDSYDGYSQFIKYPNEEA